MLCDMATRHGRTRKKGDDFAIRTTKEGCWTETRDDGMKKGQEAGEARQRALRHLYSALPLADNLRQSTTQVDMIDTRQAGQRLRAALFCMKRRGCEITYPVSN